MVPRASTAPVTAHTGRQQYVPQFTQSGRQQKQTPYRNRLTGRLVQQGLSVAGDVRECIEFGSATDKRYSLGRITYGGTVYVTTNYLGVRKGSLRYLFFLLSEDYIESNKRIAEALRPLQEKFAKDLGASGAIVRPTEGDATESIGSDQSQ